MTYDAKGMAFVSDSVGRKNIKGTFVDALLGMNQGEVWTRRRYITNVTELQFWLGWDPRMPKGLQLGREGLNRRTILCGKHGDIGAMVYVPTWEDYDAEDWLRRPLAAV